MVRPITPARRSHRHGRKTPRLPHPHPSRRHLTGRDRWAGAARDRLTNRRGRRHLGSPLDGTAASPPHHWARAAASSAHHWAGAMPARLTAGHGRRHLSSPSGEGGATSAHRSRQSHHRRRRNHRRSGGRRGRAGSAGHRHRSRPAPPSDGSGTCHGALPLVTGVPHRRLPPASCSALTARASPRRSRSADRPTDRRGLPWPAGSWAGSGRSKGSTSVSVLTAETSPRRSRSPTEKARPDGWTPARGQGARREALRSRR